MRKCEKRQIWQIYLCYFFPAGANFWKYDADTSAISTGHWCYQYYFISTFLSAQVLGEPVVQQTIIAHQQYVTGSKINTHDGFLLLFTGFYGNQRCFLAIVKCRNLRVFGANFVGPNLYLCYSNRFSHLWSHLSIVSYHFEADQHHFQSFLQR